MAIQSTIHNCACKVIKEQILWGQTVCRVWLSNQDAVVRVSRSLLRPLNSDLHPEVETHRIGYVVAAAIDNILGMSKTTVPVSDDRLHEYRKEYLR